VFSNLSNHPEFQTEITYGQFAKAGIWEQAWVIKPDQMPTIEAINFYLAGAQELAFEVFFDTAFFGLRCRGTPQHVQSVALACVQAQRSSRCGATFFSTLSSLLEVTAWGECVEFAEVGAVNFWKSIGPDRVPDLALAKADTQRLLHALLDTPLGLNTVHPKAMELDCAGTYSHWFGLRVSSDTAPFDISLPRLAAVLALA
jgi:hypothetical protein